MDRGRRTLYTVLLLSLLLPVTMSCSVESDGFAAVGVDADGGLIGMIKMCGHHVDGATLYRSDVRDGPRLGRWQADREITDFEEWSMADPQSGMTASQPFITPDADTRYSLFGWSTDNSWSATRVSFYLEALDALEPDQVIFLDGAVASKADFVANVCDDEWVADVRSLDI